MTISLMDSGLLIPQNSHELFKLSASLRSLNPLSFQLANGFVDYTVIPKNSHDLFKLPARRPTKPLFSFNPKHTIYSRNTPEEPSSICNQDQTQEAATYTVEFQTLKTCKLGISRYPDFVYNAEGGRGKGIGKESNGDGPHKISVIFNAGNLYIPPLTSSTTRFLGVPLPPFLKIEIIPELLQGTIEGGGQINLEFKARFLFSIGTIYRAPPLLVATVLTTEESKGMLKKGKGQRLDKEGNCRLIGVATVEKIDDAIMNSFLSLPTECLADLDAKISLVRNI
ncbi:hypothetical protein H6P81_006045 [Aristolochia fimbriata]|uniref:Uncharacterized protein n=1 Tax=Aristolochia fimbriata TaxID=158543 RepID=A0AAV7EXE4_ARIFI|nr:hypothetical protein H6P81_006045 [Aristolochia fimbriata]